MTPNDPLYFPRARPAEHLINPLADGIVNTLTLFAPRRMGKTQFLLNDIRPAAEAQHIDVFYFSFMDTNSHPELRFQQSLLEFADNRSASSKLKKWLASIESIDILGTSINRQQATEHISVSEIISVLAQGKQPAAHRLGHEQNARQDHLHRLQHQRLAANVQRQQGTVLSVLASD